MEKKVTARKLREKNDAELEIELGKFKEELYQMRTQKVVGATAGKLGKIKVGRNLYINANDFSSP